jgi:hypothetical protein
MLGAVAEAELSLDQLLDACESLANRLRSVPASNPIRSPMGALQLRRLLFVHCGVEVDTDTLIREASVLLRAHARALGAELEKGGTDGPLHLTMDSLQQMLGQVRLTLEPWFPSTRELFDCLDLYPPSQGSAYKGPRAGYSSMGYVFKSSRPALYYNTDMYRDPGQCLLDLVHEVFPGHHWERTHTYDAFRGRVGALTYESWPFLEGWAKYCETFYAHIVDDPDVFKAWQAQQATAALMALGALHMHCTERSVSQIVNELMRLSGLPEPAIRSTIISAYFSPIFAVAPLVGNMTLQSLASEVGSHTLHEQVTQQGPTILWGRKL